MLRSVLTFTSLLVLLAFTVLLPPKAFFDPTPTPAEVQLPEEKPCENHNCHESAVWIDDEGTLRQAPLPIAHEVVWPTYHHQPTQFVHEDLQRPPNQV